MRFPNFMVLGLSVLILAGCSATKTSIQKHDLHVETRMSETIFLEPVPPEQRVIFVQMRNTSDQPSFEISPQVRSALMGKGYRITENPAEAHFMLQANVLRVEKMDPDQSQSALLGGYGETLGGAAIGGLIGHQIGNKSAGGAIAGALIGAVGTTVANSFVTDDAYTVVTDVQVSQRPAGTMDAWDRYETRVVSSANQANLDFSEALQPLSEGLARSLAGMF
jgi:hypothetical protein